MQTRVVNTQTYVTDAYSRSHQQAFLQTFMSVTVKMVITKELNSAKGFEESESEQTTFHRIRSLCLRHTPTDQVASYSCTEPLGWEGQSRRASCVKGQRSIPSWLHAVQY